MMVDDMNASATAPVQDVNAGGDGIPQQTNDQAIPAAQPIPPAQPAQPAALTQQAGIQALVTRESRKAVEKLLKDAGITPGDNPEMQLRDYKKWQDGQKTELELAKGNAQTLTEERDAARAELAAMQSTFAAIQKGVPADKAPLYVKMTELHTADGKSFDEALDAVLKEFPVVPPAAAASGPRYAGPSGKVEQPPAKSFKEMSYGERLSLKQSNPALYAQMKGAT